MSEQIPYVKIQQALRDVKRFRDSYTNRGYHDYARSATNVLFVLDSMLQYYFEHEQLTPKVVHE